MNKTNRLKITPFTSEMTLAEKILALVWLGMHVFLLPTVLAIFVRKGQINEAMLNFLCYSIGLLFMFTAEFKFLRREFDPLCENFPEVVRTVCLCYLYMLGFNLLLSGLANLVAQLGPEVLTENQNNEAVMTFADTNYNITKAMAIFMAPVIEEVIFRGAIFGSIRKRNRTLAYIVSILLFSVYHVWGFAINDPLYWIYIVQYIPVSWLLCRCYEKTNTVWGSIMMHMLVNGISFAALSALEEMI